MIRFFMSTGGLWGLTIFTAMQAAISCYMRSYPMAVVMAGYLLADFGLLWSAK